MASDPNLKGRAHLFKNKGKDAEVSILMVCLSLFFSTVVKPSLFLPCISHTFSTFSTRLYETTNKFIQ